MSSLFDDRFQSTKTTNCKFESRVEEDIYRSLKKTAEAAITFDLKCPFGRVGHVQPSKASIRRVSVGADSQQVDVPMAHPRHLVLLRAQHNNNFC